MACGFCCSQRLGRRTIFPSAEATEILRSSGSDVWEKLNDYTAALVNSPHGYLGHFPIFRICSGATQLSGHSGPLPVRLPMEMSKYTRGFFPVRGVKCGMQRPSPDLTGPLGRR